MQYNTTHTDFASPLRSDPEDIQRQARLIQNKVGLALLNAMPDIVLILNEHRQAVFASNNLLELLGLEDDAALLGQRPGEIFGCDKATNAPGGCGTAQGCRYCGAVHAILSSLEGRSAQEECRMVTRSESRMEAHDLRVSGTPLMVDDKEFVLFVIQDISHEKRRRALERIFFHDILNTAGGLSNLVHMFVDELPDSLRDDADMLRVSFTQMVEEIISHKLLLAAESEDLTVQPMQLQTLEFLEMVKTYGENLRHAEDRTIAIDPSSKDFTLTSDYTLLRRCMGNLVKNALEASMPGETVTMGCSAGDREAVLWVRNEGVMKDAVKLQLFQRSFSTKGVGRGLGTYSVKLLTEGYLGGKVEFESCETAGTIFRIRLPRS